MIQMKNINTASLPEDNMRELEDGEIYEPQLIVNNNKQLFIDSSQNIHEYYNNYIIYGITKDADAIQELAVDEPDDFNDEEYNSEDELPRCSIEEEDDEDYEYCEIMKGVWHRRRRYEDEDPDELHRRINNAKTAEERAEAFWG